MFLSSFVCKNIALSFNTVSQELLNDLITLHKTAEITFASHLDPKESERDPVVINNGKVLLVFPPFPQMYSYGCFHSKLIMIRFPDRLRVEMPLKYEE